MKTNQTMMVKIGNYTQQIEHLTMMGNLNALWTYGNGLREAKGFTSLDMSNWIRSTQTRELVLAIEKRYYVNFTEYEILANGTTKWLAPLNCLKTKMGKGGGTWAHLILMLDAAAQLDADFKLEMYEAFINNKILQWRDDGGDEFNTLSAFIDLYLPDRKGKDNKGIIINIAKMVREITGVEGKGWNEASYSQLEKRANIERKLCDFLKIGLIRDWDHMKELLPKI
jgi:hypothetical protein